MKCPNCNSELTEFPTTVYVLDKRTKKSVPVDEPWMICRNAIESLMSEKHPTKCRFVSKKEEMHTHGV